MLKVVAENMDAYYDFHVNKLGQVENIGHVQSTFVMGVIKDGQPQIWLIISDDLIIPQRLYLWAGLPILLKIVRSGMKRNVSVSPVL